MNTAGNKPQTRDKFIGREFQVNDNISSQDAEAFQKDFCLVISELIGVVLKLNRYSEGECKLNPKLQWLLERLWIKLSEYFHLLK